MLNYTCLSNFFIGYPKRCRPHCLQPLQAQPHTFPDVPSQSTARLNVQVPTSPAVTSGMYAVFFVRFLFYLGNTKLFANFVAKSVTYFSVSWNW